MQIAVTGKQLDVGEALRRHVADNLPNAVAKYFDTPIEGQVVLSREAHLFCADISVHARRKLLVQGHGKAADAYAAVDSAIERIAKQLRRYKRRLRSHKARSDGADSVWAQQYILSALPEETEDTTGEDGLHPVVVAEMRTEIDALTVGEAVMRMDLTDAHVMVFRNRAHGGLNVVYRRPDGNIGWIDPGQSADQGTTG